MHVTEKLSINALLQVHNWMGQTWVSQDPFWGALTHLLHTFVNAPQNISWYPCQTSPITLTYNHKGRTSAYGANNVQVCVLKLCNFSHLSLFSILPCYTIRETGACQFCAQAPYYFISCICEYLYGRVIWDKGRKCFM